LLYVEVHDYSVDDEIEYEQEQFDGSYKPPVVNHVDNNNELSTTDDFEDEQELKIYEEEDDAEYDQSSSVNNSSFAANPTVPLVATKKPTRQSHHGRNKIPNTDNHYERQYTCKTCSYLTNNPRAILYHRKEMHKERIPIYECAYCQYASQYSGKVERHTLLRHKIDNNTSATSANSHHQSQMQPAVKHTSTPTKNLRHEPPVEPVDDMQDPMSGSQQLTFQCDKCPCKYKRSNDLYKHLRLKHLNDNGTADPINAQPDYNNDNEDEQMGQQSEQDSFDTSVNNDKKHECPYCTFQVESERARSEYIDHINEHLCGKTYRCILCNSIYKYRGDCVVHLKRKHQKNDLIAQQYVEKFLLHEQNTLTMHDLYMKLKPKVYLDLDNDKKLFGCSYCDYKANYKGDVYKHQTRRHPSFVKNIKTLEQQQDELPTLTNTSATHLSFLYQQQQQQQQQEDSYDQEQIDIDADDQSYMINDTMGPNDNTDSNQDNFSNLYECHLCPYKAKNQAKLQFHLATHDNLKPYMCPVCKRRANFKWDIQKHLRKVHMDAESEVICLTQSEARQTIGKYIEYYGQNQRTLSTSSSSSPMTTTPSQMFHGSSKHSFMPTKHSIRERKYKCSMCNRTSKWQWDIRKHLRTVHKDTSNTGDVIVLDDKDILFGRHNYQHHYQQQPLHKTELAPHLSKPMAMANNQQQHLVKPSQPAKHINLMSIGSDATGNKKFKCTLCPYRSNWKADLFRHIRKRHFISQPTIENVIILTPDEAACTINDYETTHGIYIRKRSRCVDDYSTMATTTNNNKRQCFDTGKTNGNHKEDIDCSKRQQLPLSPPQSTTSNTTTTTTSMASITHKKLSVDEEDIDDPIDAGSIENNGSLRAVPVQDTVKTFQCLKCFYKTIRKADLMRHLKVRHSLHPSLLSKYMKISFDNKMATKAYGKFSVLPIGSNDNGTSHNGYYKKANGAVMTNKNYYKCNICSYKSEWRYSVKKHIISQHWQIQHANVVKCNFKNIDEFNSINSSSGYNSKTANMGAQNGKHQSSTDSNQLILPNGKSYTSAFVLTSSASNHPNSHLDTSTNLNASDSSDMNCTKKKMYFCESCPYKTNNYCNLKQHLLQHRPEAGIAKCRYCPYYVSMSRLLKQHEILHLEYEPRNSSFIGSGESPAMSNGNNFDENEDDVESGIENDSNQVDHDHEQTTKSSVSTLSPTSSLSTKKSNKSSDCDGMCPLDEVCRDFIVN
jgi:hypothetical protein